MPKKLVDINIEEVSGVDKAANGRTFLVVKRAEGGEKVDEPSLIKKITKIIKGILNGDDTSKDFNEVLDDQEKQELVWQQKSSLWKFTDALNAAIISIIESDSVTDKKAAVIESIQQYYQALLDTEVVKAGKKISNDRLSALKQAHEALGKVITDADNNNEGDDNVAKGEHVKGCQCEKCLAKEEVGKKAEPATDEAVQKRLKEIEKRNSEIEKRNQELEAQIKKQNDELKTKEFIAKAAGFTNLGIKADELGPVLKSMAEANPEGFAKIEATLKAADEQVAKGALFSEAGRSGTGETSVVKKVQAMADEMIAKGASMTKEQALAKAWKDNPELYKQYQKELRGE